MVLFLRSNNYSKLKMLTPFFPVIIISFLLSYVLHQNKFLYSFIYIYIGISFYNYYSDIILSGAKTINIHIEKYSFLKINDSDFFISKIFEKILYLLVNLFFALILSFSFLTIKLNIIIFFQLLLLISFCFLLGINLFILGYLFRIFLPNYIFLLNLLLRIGFFATPVFWFADKNFTKSVFLTYNPFAELVSMPRRILDISHYENSSFFNIIIILITFLAPLIYLRFKKNFLNIF